MSRLFIGTSKPPEFDESIDYRIDPVEYAKLMKLRWPYAKIGFVDSQYYVLDWELNQQDRLGPSGGLQSNKLVVSFGSSPQSDALDFILWHRSFVPIEVPLFLFDESLSLAYELRPGVSREELATLF